EAAEEVGLRVEVRLVQRAEREVDRALRGAERERALRGEQRREFPRTVDRRVGELVDESDPERLVRVDRPPGEDQVLRDADAADPREPLRATPARDDPEVDLGLSELRRRGGDPDVA